MGRPREHGPAERAALVTVASRILAAEGVSAVTVRRTAEEAGTTTRAVYSLFGDKDGLLRALFLRNAETMLAHHEAVPVAKDPIKEIVPLALAYRASARELPHLYELQFSGASLRLKLQPEDIQLAFRSFERVLDTIRRCLAVKVFASRSAEEIGVGLFALVHGLASLELRGFLGSPEQAERHWVDAVNAAVEGYRAPRPRRPMRRSLSSQSAKVPQVGASGAS